MLEHGRINVSEEIDVNKTNISNECDICHYWHIEDIGFKYEPNLCYGCHDLILNTAEDYYKNNKEVLREQAKNKYREISEDEKNIKREHGRNRYHSMFEEKKQNVYLLYLCMNLFLSLCIYNYPYKPVHYQILYSLNC